MACKIETINNEELKSLVAQYGATEGLKMFLNGDYNKIKPGVPELFESNPELANDVKYQLPQDREIEEFVASEKTIRDLAARMSDRIGIPVRFESDRSKKYKGKIENNIAYINLAYATLDTPIHEILGHSIIRALKNNMFTMQYDENGKYIKNNTDQLYQNLLKELEYGRGKEVLDRIKRDYVTRRVPTNYRVAEIYPDDFSNIDKVGKFGIFKSEKQEDGRFRQIPFKFFDTFEEGLQYIKDKETVYYTLEEQQEEAIVELLGLMTAEKLDAVKDGKLISLLKRLLKEMKAFMKQLLGQKEVEIDKLPDNMTLGDIADLLAYSNSKLILPGNEVVYTTPDNQQFKTYAEASKHISNLAKSVEDVNLSNVDINNQHIEIKNIPNEFSGVEDEGVPFYVIKLNNKWFINYDRKLATEEGVEISEEKAKDYFRKKQGIGVIKDFIEKNKEYEQSKEITEEWKKVNNIQYNPEEIYSRGQEFVSVVGAYSNFDVNLMMQNLLQHIEDNEKAGGKFTISAFTKPIDKQIGHLEGGGGKIKFKIYPKSEDILWAANTDVYSGSVWDASEKVNKDKKSELLGVSYTKYPSLRNVNSVQPNLASIIDDLAHHHNELGISLTGNNFRLEYDEDIPYSTKKIINSINSILDQKYGRLVKPEITKPKLTLEQRNRLDYLLSLQNKAFTEPLPDFMDISDIWSKDNQEELNTLQSISAKQPTQTNETLKESIESVKNYIIEFSNKEQAQLDYLIRLDERNEITTDQEIELKELKNKKKNITQKEYTSQALINTKIAKLKEVAKKYPRSLIRSEVRFINSINQNYGFEQDEMPFQKLSSKQDIENFVNFVNKDNESKYLVDPNQLPIDFEGANRIREAEIKLTKARAEWDLFCKVSIKDKATAVSHSNEALYNVYPALKRDYPNLDIKIEKHHVRGYYTITVFNPDVKYFRNREGLDEYGNIIIPKFLTDSKIKDKASDKKNPFGEIVIRNQSLIKILESRLSDAKLNSKQASEIKAKISRLENQIEKIIEVNKLSAILDVGSNQAIELTKRLSSIKDKLNESDNIELDDLRTIISSLVDIKYYIDIWEDLNEVFDVQIDDDHLMQTSELVGKYDGLKNTYATLLEKALIEYFNKESYGTFSRNEVFGSAVDTSYMTMQLQGIQHSDTELLRIANDIIKKSLFDINSELISKSKSINDMTDKLVKLFPGKELDTFKKFLQYDKNGNWTGNLVTENSQAYYDKLRELGQLRKSKKLSYAQWLEAVSKMQHRMTKEIIDNNDTTYFTQEEINAQKEMLQIYERDMIAEEESLKLSGELFIPGENRIDGAELERRMLNWANENNPYLYWEKIKEGNFKNLPKRAYRYILEPKAKEEWHDKGYKEVMDNKTLKEFYLFMVKTFTDNNKVFPQNYKPNQKNYLPELNKSFAEELSKDRGLSMIKGIPDAMINAITTEVNGNIDFNINIGGKVIKSIPIHMMSDRLDTNEKSIDLRKIMLAHTAMSLNYKHKAEILPVIQAIQDRLDDMVETTLNTTNTDYKRTIFGVKQNLGKRLNNTKKHLEHTIDTWIFNNNKDTSFVAKQGMFLTKEEKETKKQLKDKLDAREITQDEYDEQVNKLGKHLSADEIGDSLIRYTYLKSLSFPNVVSPAVNMFFGVLSNLSYAAGGVDFTDKEIIESTGIMMRSISKTLGGKLHSETIEKVYAWMEKMKLLGDINESMYGKEKTIADKLVILQMKAEVINQGSVMIAMLKNKKVKDLQGNDVSLWNAYKVINGELVWDKEKLGEQPEGIKDKIIEGNSVNLYRLSNQIKAVVKRIHGDYENPLRIKRNVLGRMLILFKTWLPATLKERFGKLDYDQDLGRDIKGRYISIFNSRDNSNYDINFHKSLATFAKLILTQNFLTKNIAKKSLNEYSAVDAENLKRAAREAQIIIALMIVGLLLKSIDTDDDEEKQVLNLLINTLGKTNADLMFFFNPGAMMNVGSNPIPPLKTLTDFLKIIPVTYNTLTGNPRYENGPWKDHLRYEKWTYINIPWMVAPAVKMISLADKQYDYSGVE